MNASRSGNRKNTMFFSFLLLSLLLASCVYTPVSPLESLDDKQKEWENKGVAVTVQCGRTAAESWRATTNALLNKISPNSVNSRRFFETNGKFLGVISNIVSGGMEGMKGLGPVPVCFWAAASRSGTIAHAQTFGFQLRGKLVQIFATPAYDKMGLLRKYLLAKRMVQDLLQDHVLLKGLGADDPNAFFIPAAKKTVVAMRSSLGISFSRTTTPALARELAEKFAEIGLPVVPKGRHTAFLVEGLLRKEGPYRHASFIVTEPGTQTTVVSWAGYVPKKREVGEFFMSLWRL